MKRLLFVTVLVAIVTLAGFVGAQRLCGLVCAPAASRDWLSGLDLDDAQRAELARLDKEFLPRERELCARICRERAALHALIADKDAADAEVLAKIDSAGAMQVKLEKTIASHVFGVKRALRPDQAATYVKRMKSGMQCPVPGADGRLPHGKAA